MVFRSQSIIKSLIFFLFIILIFGFETKTESKEYNLEKVVEDLRIPTEMPGKPEKGYVTTFFNDMVFANKKIGWVTSGGFLGKSTDGGKTWVPAGSKRGGLSIFFLNEKLGWGSGFKKDSFGNTLDGGTTWNFWKNSTVPCCGKFFFVDPQNGWALGQGQIYHTSDGGKTWVKQTSRKATRLKDLYFIDQSQGWVISLTGEVLHTKDGGNHWKIQKPKDHVSVRRIKFFDEKVGCIVGSKKGPLIYRTEDGGESWEETNLPFPSVKEEASLHDILIINSKEAWIVGWPNLILKTEDGGKTWNTLFLGKAPAPVLISISLVKQDGRETILILSGAGELFRIFLN